MEDAKREEEFRQKEEEKHKKEIERRIHPKNPKDFEILYKELEVNQKQLLAFTRNNSLVFNNLRLLNGNRATSVLFCDFPLSFVWVLWASRPFLWC